MARVLFHIRLNELPLAAERARHPELNEKAIALSSLTDPGVILMADKEALKLGITKGMSVNEAVKLSPELFVLPPDTDYYRSLSAKVFSCLKRFSTALEMKGLDEAYLDVTQIIRKYKRPLDLSVQIQSALKQQTGLLAAIGIAPTKFLARTASSLKKPAGITVLRKSDIEARLLPLPIETLEDMPSESRILLLEKGIRKIGDLADPQNRPLVEPVLKEKYPQFMDWIYGRSEDKLSYSTTKSTMSAYKPVSNREEIERALTDLCGELYLRSKKTGSYGRTLAVILKDSEANSRMHSKTLDHPLDSAELLRETAFGLLNEHIQPVNYRQVGIQIGSFDGYEQINPAVHEPVRDPLREILNRFNKEIEGTALKRASDLLDGSK